VLPRHHLAAGRLELVPAEITHWLPKPSHTPVAGPAEAQPARGRV
jgi:hypothetical protein